MKKPKFIPEFRDIPSERQKMPELSLEERNLNFKEVELGLSEEMVLKEAARCLSCRRCIGCGLCLAECNPQAIVYDEAATTVEIEADAIVFASDGRLFNPDGKKELGYCSSANVITSFEFERLVSPTGPFGGLLVRPFDGDVPRRIAFIQCVGSREEGIGANYCSADCCSRTLSQARRARDLAGDIGVRVFHRGLRPLGKRSEVDLDALKDEKWIDFVEAGVTGVKEDPASGTVTVAYSGDGETAEGEFDLVVLAVGIQAEGKFRRYARAGGTKVNKFGFIERRIGSLVAEAEGVAFGGAVCGPGPADRGVIDGLAAATRSLDSSLEEAGEATGGNGEGMLIYACKYGLELAGCDSSVLESLKADGFEIAGTYPFLCYKDGRAAMIAGSAGASSIVIIGCHKGSHEELFEQMTGLARGRITIIGGTDVGKGLKESLSAAGAAARVPRTPQQKPARVVVAGGGTSGLAAASELVRRNVPVVIVEKSQEVGKTLSQAAIVDGADIDVVEGFMKSLEAHPDVRIITSSSIVSTERSGGKLLVKVSTPQGEEVLEAGAVLLATGSRAYVPEEYPHGGGDQILTQSEFRERITAGEVDFKRVAMIQCVGARDASHRYCSRFCCKQALANALRFKQENRDSEVTVFHKGIRVFGFEEDLYTDAADEGVSFVEVRRMPAIESGKTLTVKGEAKDGTDVSIECDAVVLSVAHSHGDEQEELARITGVGLDDLGFFVSGDPLLDPFASPVDGIFICGFARAPVTAEEAFVDGLGAAGVIRRYLGP